MRIIGFLLAIIGLGIAFLWPWAQLNMFTEEFERLEFTKIRDNEIEQQVVWLNADQNTIRLRFIAEFEIGASLAPVNVPLIAKVADQKGILTATILKFPTDGDNTGPEQPKVTRSRSLEFDVENEGPHQIILEPAPRKENDLHLSVDFLDIEVVVIENASVIDQDLKIPGAVLAVFGFYLIIRSRRGRKQEKKKFTWGRDGAE